MHQDSALSWFPPAGFVNSAGRLCCAILGGWELTVPPVWRVLKPAFLCPLLVSLKGSKDSELRDRRSGLVLDLPPTVCDLGQAK